jgi:superfamily I DNA and/or RNA helicase
MKRAYEKANRTISLFQGRAGDISSSTIMSFLEYYFPHIKKGIEAQMADEDDGFTKVSKKKESKPVQAYNSWINCSDFDEQHLLVRNTNSKLPKFKRSKNKFATLSDERHNPALLEEYTEPDSDRDIEELLYSFGEWSRVERIRFDAYIRELLPQQAQEALETCCQEFNELSKKKASLKESTEQRVLSGTRIIGATTTGAAKSRNLLSEVRPSIVIVEEAGEILEANLISCLGNYVQHCILIGDHQQLRPKVHHCFISYNRSLFMIFLWLQRLVNDLSWVRYFILTGVRFEPF